VARHETVNAFQSTPSKTNPVSNKSLISFLRNAIEDNLQTYFNQKDIPGFALYADFLL